jgi:hypothetical protein
MIFLKDEVIKLRSRSAADSSFYGRPKTPTTPKPKRKFMVTASTLTDLHMDDLNGINTKF